MKDETAKQIVRLGNAPDPVLRVEEVEWGTAACDALIVSPLYTSDVPCLIMNTSPSIQAPAINLEMPITQQEHPGLQSVIYSCGACVD